LKFFHLLFDIFNEFDHGVITIGVE